MINIVYAVIHAILSMLIPFANLLVMVVIYQLRKKKPCRNYIFILNLAAADLLVGVMCIGEAYDNATNELFDTDLTLCLLKICLNITPCIGSILTLLLVSLDRYLAVRLPLYYPTVMGKRPIVFSLVILWTISFLVGHLPLIAKPLQQPKFFKYCGILSATKSNYLYIICFGIFIPALLTLVFLHVSVGRIAYLHHKQIQHACLCSDSTIAHLRHFKALRTILVFIFCFILFWGPYYVAALVRAICSSCSLSSELKEFLFLLGEINSLINPFIYSLYSKDIRTQFVSLMKYKRKKQIQPYRANSRAQAHVNNRTQNDLTSRGSTKPNLSENRASNSPPFNSSSDYQAVFSVS